MNTMPMAHWTQNYTTGHYGNKTGQLKWSLIIQAKTVDMLIILWMKGTSDRLAEQGKLKKQPYILSKGNRLYTLGELLSKYKYVNACI